ncbi:MULTISPECIES: hypothetical protein [unclassified Methanoculleus]|jgi:hypothetical protein|uniref:hypothetical protein n=1 Tax=unclassified Methanoculleus TaxID=2619537 RepID=UPI00319E97B2
MTPESKPFGFLPLRSDRTIAPGTLTCTATGGLLVLVEAERCRITPEDAKRLIFSGHPAPVTCERVRRTGGVVTGALTIEGYAAMNLAGRAVVIRTRIGSWIVPLVSFQRVVRGEASSAPLFPLIQRRAYG